MSAPANGPAANESQTSPPSPPPGRAALLGGSEGEQGQRHRVGRMRSEATLSAGSRFLCATASRVMFMDITYGALRFA